MEDKKDPSPALGGSLIGYKAEFRSKQHSGEWSVWQQLSTRKVLPYESLDRSTRVFAEPLFDGDILSAIGMQGYEQAQAIAWSCLSDFAAIGKSRHVEVRIQPYRIEYNIKAWKEEHTIALNAGHKLSDELPSD